ncbi:MAG: hypothetical protein Q4C73_09465 [Eubacteriales bacterium]|nr:hypothetical protein [Eubacteriales bacterium]
MGKFLDKEGLERVWDAANGKFVAKEDGKGLSSNDFTDEWKQKIEDLAYSPMAISAFTNNVNTAEMGSTVNAVTLNWTLNKTPKSQKVDNTAVDAAQRTLVLSEQTIQADKTYTLSATDERDKTVTKTTNIRFYNGVYWGIADAEQEIDSAFLLTLSKGLQASRAKTFSVTAGKGEHIIYAVPARYGTCLFNVGGFDGGFSKVATIEFTNASGYTESYDVYKSTNADLGSTTVTVK